MKRLHNLHCGACMEDFDDIKNLNIHLENCPAARIMLPSIYKLWMGLDKIGHPGSHFINNLHINVNLIKRYAYAVADEMDVFSRSKLHAELCQKLDLDYNKFRPFESSDIIDMPNRKEAENILWEEIKKELDKKFK